MLDAMTHYEQECREKCPEGCGKGLAVKPSYQQTFGGWIESRAHFTDDGRMWCRCLAPTESEFAERMAQEVEQLKAKQSITFGDLSPLVQERIEPHEWDSMNISEQRNWALEMLVATIVSIEYLPDSQDAQANLEAENARLREARHTTWPEIYCDTPGVLRAFLQKIERLQDEKVRLRAALQKLYNAVKVNHTMQGREYVDLGIEVNAALAATGEPECSTP